MKLCKEKLFSFLSKLLLSPEEEEGEESGAEELTLKATAAYLASCLMTGSGEWGEGVKEIKGVGGGWGGAEWESKGEKDG